MFLCRNRNKHLPWGAGKPESKGWKFKCILTIFQWGFWEPTFPKKRLLLWFIYYVYLPASDSALLGFAFTFLHGDVVKADSKTCFQKKKTYLNVLEEFTSDQAAEAQTTVEDVGKKSAWGTSKVPEGRGKKGDSGGQRRHKHRKLFIGWKFCYSQGWHCANMLNTHTSTQTESAHWALCRVQETRLCSSAFCSAQYCMNLH